MTFDEILDQVIALLKRQGRVSYRALKMRFDEIDDEYLDVLKEELIDAQRLATDEDGRIMVWAGAMEMPEAPSQPDQITKPIVQAEPPTQVVSPPPEPPTPDAERRQLTVMFCDLADSTRLSGQLDPEDLRDVIRAYQSTSAEVIERYDGYIAQHLGDGLMVYFGWPQAHEDDAQRVVHAGLGIIEAMQGLNERLEREKGICLAVRIGIHTGIVVVGEMGQGASQEHLALGETPNIASRIEGIATPDTVAISNATYQLVRGYFVCEDVGHYHLKGVSDAQQVHRVLRESAAQSRLDVAAASGLTPLIGRESEVTLLLERWQQVKEGQGQVVLLSGEAGIGKSRLLRVLREHIANQLHTLQACRCSPYHTQSAFYPLIDLLQRKLDWQSEDAAPVRLRKLETVLGQTHLDREIAVPLFSSLLSLPSPDGHYVPLTLSSQRQRQETLEAFLRIVLLETEQHPVLFIVEDVHWVDPSTLEFLDLLIGQAATAALLIVLTCRPEFQSPWGLRTYLTPIALNRLTRPQIEQMVVRVSGEKALPPEVIGQLVEKTDGVPLYIEEMTKAVLESDVLRQAAGDEAPIAGVGSLAIPATLQDSLMARLDRLGSAKAVAQYGAVIGRQFSYDLLHAVAQLDEVTLQQALRRLVESELLYQRGLPPTAIYTFKHALIQDVAYQSLLKSTRQHHHQAIAQLLVERFPETTATQPELLAHHYTEAGLHALAINYWQQAGEQAIGRSANAEAVSHLTQGLALLKTLPQSPQSLQQELVLQTTLGPALMAVEGQGAAEVGAVYNRAKELCQQVGETPQLFPVLFGQWRFYFMQSELHTAREVGLQSLHLAQRLDDSALILPAHFTLGASLLFAGDLASAHKHLTTGVRLYNPQAHRALAFTYGIDLGVWCLAYLAWTLYQLGYLEQSVQRAHEALRLAQELAHPLSLAAVQVYAAFPYAMRHEGQMAQAQAEAAMVLSREQGFPQWLTLGMIYRGFALAEQGHYEAAITQLREGIDAWQAMGPKLGVPTLLTLMAEVYSQIGQVDEGLNLLSKALSIAAQSGERWWDAESYRVQGELQLQQGAAVTSQAESCFHRALDTARQQGAKSFELRAATSLARLWQSQGKRQEAYELLAPVYGWFTEGFDTADLKDAKALLQELDG